MSLAAEPFHTTGRARRPLPKKAASRRDAHARQPHYKKLVERGVPTFGSDEWSVVLLRGKGRKRLDLTGITESIDWTDASATLTGTLTLRMPVGRFDISAGHQIALRHRRAGTQRFRTLWLMRISAPSDTLSSHAKTLTLNDDIALLKASTDDWRYVKDKAHPKGWLPHEIVADVCKRYGIRALSIPVMKTRIKNLTKKAASPFDVIVAAVLKEKEATKKRYVIRWRNGLVIDRLRRARSLYVLGPTLIDAVLTESVKDAFATTLTVNATGKHAPKGKKKIKVEVSSAARIARYGRIHKTIDAPDANTAAEARKFGKKQLLDLAKPTRELALSHPGIATVRRGQAIEVFVPEEDLRVLAFIKEARHTVSGSDYNMDLVMRFTDPFFDDKSLIKAKADRQKCEAARKRKRKAPKGCENERQHGRPKPAKGRTRASSFKRTGSVGGSL